MSKGLVLTRKAGQGVEFTDSLTGAKHGMTVLRVTGGNVRFHFDTAQPIELQIGQYAPVVGLDLELTLLGIAKGQAKFGFDGAKTVKILRTELNKNDY